MGLASALATTYKQRLQAIVLIPSDGGRFEVELDGTAIYSKLATGQFPEHHQIKKELDRLLRR